MFEILWNLFIYLWYMFEKWSCSGLKTAISKHLECLSLFLDI